MPHGAARLSGCIEEWNGKSNRKVYSLKSNLNASHAIAGARTDLKRRLTNFHQFQMLTQLLHFTALQQ